jgi:heterodisulfide reductase subunit A
MVVHAIGMDPNVDNPNISDTFGVDLEQHGYIGVANTYGTMGETSRPGVFVAGSATGPETIDDSIAQGHAAAMAVLSGAREFSKSA